MFKTYKTERLLLKPTSIEDAAFVLELLNTPKWIENIGERNVKTAIDAEQYIKDRMLPQLERLGYSNYTMIRLEDGVKIGSCGLYDREGVEGVDIGFALLPNYEGNGYAFEGANKIKELAFSKFNLEQINAITLPSNNASRVLLEKLGLSFIKLITLPNDDEELMLYQIKKAKSN